MNWAGNCNSDLATLTHKHPGEFQELSDTESTWKMIFSILWFVLLSSGLILAQDDGNTIETEKAGEIKSCYPDMCDLLREFGAMREKLGAMETRLKDSEIKLKDSEKRLNSSETRLKDSENQILELRNKGKVENLSTLLNNSTNICAGFFA